jgi:hypothetical protein
MIIWLSHGRPQRLRSKGLCCRLDDIRLLRKAGLGMHFHGKFYLRFGWRGVRGLRCRGRSLCWCIRRLRCIGALGIKRRNLVSAVFAITVLLIFLVFGVQSRGMLAGSGAGEPFARGRATSVAFIRCPRKVLVVATRKGIRSGTRMCGASSATPGRVARIAMVGRVERTTTVVAIGGVVVMRRRTPRVTPTGRSIHRSALSKGWYCDLPSGSISIPSAPGIFAVICRLMWVS